MTCPTCRTFNLYGLSLLVVLLAAFTAGCGYSHKELFSDEYTSVAVPIFENRTFYRGVERDLGEALVKEIEQRTPYKVISPNAANTILQGTILKIEQNQLARRRPGGVPEELEVTITVDFEWKDLRTGQIIRDRKGFEAVGRYVPTSPVGQPFEVGQHMAVQALARDIVSTLQANW